MTVLVIEGGGKGNKALQSRLREGFGELIRRSGVATRHQIVMGGGRGDAWGEYQRQHALGHQVLCLIDSEHPVLGEDPWAHVKRHEGWERPAAASATALHFMVQLTESWFLADANALKRYFGQTFVVPGNIETIDKAKVLAQLKTLAAASTKREYDKGRDSHALLKLLDPEQIKQRSVWASRFFDALKH